MGIRIEPRNYPEKRIHFSQNSLEKVKEMRRFFEEIQQEIPELAGISFFGSRIIKRERADSDLDLMIFFDGSHYAEELKNFSDEIRSEDGHINPGLDIDTTFKKIREISEKQKELILKIKNKFIEKTKSLGLPIDENQVDKTILLADISHTSTDECILDFTHMIAHSSFSDGSPKFDFISQNVMQLAARFFIGTGEKLYQNRRYVLDKFKALNDGEIQFQYFMKLLQHIERVGMIPDKKQVDLYQNYPKTINEAYIYFQ